MLDPLLVELATGANFATFTTLLPDGSPQSSVMWFDIDDDHVLINTEVHRLKYRNVQRDPRVALVVWDHANPYRYVEVRGRVIATEGGARAREHIDRLSERYTGGPYAAPITSERVLLVIEPERQRRQG
ncbi:pyridoxamine 5'-phosphate oxidase-related FMN- binding [Acidimicrobium ferrooxidans DSM 10331]|uniref:Pyridoxamine 5'-phosphate oxidase-related FMN-binding n=1 Tax=Acidimicrobium ferrooxidans (strain DSM 10331 / JCM 15462 / NBRC 103882 / ICP) TaxID=525909 RepID=C7LY37_ACIFD|nr:PPOX class F420-dependent oxidoreductase [Acidimicrobium ferrooxidans]ACU53645.1 pyridoxamine 5'-phosphate oxidase-related FMN- binding [Acidimicrobium ferrooxidans DSM 10331]